MLRARPHVFALERTQVVQRPLEEVFTFFAEAQNLEAITPPWLRFEILEAPDRIKEGSRVRYRLRLFGVPVFWHTEIVARWRPPQARQAPPLHEWATFTDVQISGPYRLWEHTHRFSRVPGGTEIYDHIRYRVPGGPLAPLLQRLFVGRWLDEIFHYRAERLAELLG